MQERAQRRRRDRTNMFGRIHEADPHYVPPCIFDIGANVGQTVAQIRDVFPAVPVHAFEPVASTFAGLQAAIAQDTMTTAHRSAFGARCGTAVMMALPGGVQNRILPSRTTRPDLPHEEVEVIAGDVFCARHGIGEIGILKVDAEGHDLDVLAGFHGMLAARRIHYIVIECAVSPRDRAHVPLNRIAEFVFAFEYLLFGVFPADGGFRPVRSAAGGPNLRGMFYGNAVFVAEPWEDQGQGRPT
jgi:FkbM family methyltransferase